MVACCTDHRHGAGSKCCRHRACNAGVRVQQGRPVGALLCFLERRGECATGAEHKTANGWDKAAR
eukprot:9115768-Pyramimonas_sp.AAC.1